MDSSCRDCKERLGLLNIDPEQLRGGKYNYAVCEACTNYYPEEHTKEPPVSYQVKYKVYRFINPQQEKINAQQNFKIAQVESQLKEHLEPKKKLVKKWQ